MKKFLIAISMLLPLSLGAQNIKTNNNSEDYYSDEIGFFQKAYRDKSDPRFMFKDGDFEFGIGGRVQTSMFYDIAGPIGSTGFATSYINVPNDRTPNFGVITSGSEVHFKARAKIGSHKVLAYTKISLSANDAAKFDQAYISFDGFTIGKTYSFFSDLEAGPRSLDDSGVNSELNMSHPLLGYTRRINEHMIFGAALEKASVNLSAYSSSGIDTEYQSMPDIAMRLKYKGSKGHVQIAGILRNLGYWVYTPPKTTNMNGETRYTFGYGASVSGNYTPTARLRFSAQATAGRGIAAYVRDFVNRGVSLAMNYEFQDGYAVLTPRLTCATFATAQYKWTDKLSSNVTGGYVYAGRDENTYLGSDTKSTLYTSANILYDISNFCYLGLECLHGVHNLYPQDDSDVTSGRANRILLVFSYSF